MPGGGERRRDGEHSGMEPELRQRRPLSLVVCVATEMEGALLRPQVPVITTGVGAVNAAYALTRFLDREQVNAIVVCGIGGAYPGSGLAVGGVACAESECYGDLGASSPG